MLKLTALALATVALTAAPQAPAPAVARPAQSPTAAATPPQPQKAAEAPGQPLNIRLELIITDQAGSGAPTKKTISMIVADRQNGFIRSRGRMGSGRDVTINVDARPTITREGSIRIDLGLEYQPAIETGSSEVRAASQTRAASDAPQVPTPFGMPSDYSNLNQRIGVLLESGKALTISQSADPGSSRQISVEAKATILK